ncbi:hypothetical protein [Rhizobium giardinii]|uniref:hypothetical protein n=1 Tax=Rhizobium giardinii TaxID=56731 RepID=UPI003D6EB7C0
MSNFRRSGHYRTNSSGTTFWVSSHDVSRDEWYHGGPSGRPREILLSYKGTSYGITYPNARCPICKEYVFFFAAHNGGRVFFDPPLGPPWPKHPCTISETATIAKTTGAEEGYSAPSQAESLTYEIYPQLTGSVIVLEIDGQEKAYSTSYEFDQPHIERVWPVRNSRGTVTALSLLTSEFEPVELPVRARRLPAPMGQSNRRKLALKALSRIPALMRNIEAASSEASDYDFLVGGAFVAVAGDDATIFVPTPVDHKVEWIEEERQSIREYMYETASEALAALAQRRPARPPLAPRPKIVFCLDDCLGMLRNNNTYELGLEYGDDLAINESWRHPKPWLGSLQARIAWIDAFSTENVAMPDGRITIEEAFEFEAEFCNSIWPDGDHGRWRKIQEVTTKLGIAEQFQALVGGLRKGGWLLASLDEFGCPLTHELVFAQKTGEASPRFRLLLSLCSTAGLAVLAGWAEEQQPAEEFLAHVKTEEQLASLLNKLKSD